MNDTFVKLLIGITLYFWACTIVPEALIIPIIVLVVIVLAIINKQIKNNENTKN